MGTPPSPSSRLMLSPLLALAMTARKEPVPLSAVVVTVRFAAQVGAADTHSAINQTQRFLRFLSDCGFIVPSSTCELPLDSFRKIVILLAPQNHCKRSFNAFASVVQRRRTHAPHLTPACTAPDIPALTASPCANLPAHFSTSAIPGSSLPRRIRPPTTSHPCQSISCLPGCPNRRCRR